MLTELQIYIAKFKKGSSSMLSILIRAQERIADRIDSIVRLNHWGGCND